MSSTYFDVLIIGAGLSGIGAACHLSQSCPNKTFTVLERRRAIGGTWDLFRYPGVRSDSDMLTFGYQFRPWRSLNVLADGTSIRNYISDTAKAYGIDKKINFGLKVQAANWSSQKKRWTVLALDEETGEKSQYECAFLITGTGYYNYDAGYLPNFKGADEFKGLCIHPQKWPADLDYTGKKVVVIGSGATAVTLVPAMAEKAAHVTMLQRSPSYVFSIPAYDAVSAALRKILPDPWVYSFARKRNIFLQRTMFKMTKRWPNFMRRFFISRAQKHLGKDFDISHFSPRYKPWDERLCAVPDADLFKVLQSGEASIVTDQIESFTATGLRLMSGQKLEADIIVTATGLDIQLLGGIELKVDEAAPVLSELLTYKGAMVQNIPNMVFMFGYTNAPWTLKADLSASYACRLLRYMEQHNATVAVARDEQGCALDTTVMSSLGSGYIERASELLPRQGSKQPWIVLDDYKADRDIMLNHAINDGILNIT